MNRRKGATSLLSSLSKTSMYAEDYDLTPLYPGDECIDTCINRIPSINIDNDEHILYVLHLIK